MEVNLSMIGRYHEAVTTDEQTAKMLCKMHGESAVLTTHCIGDEIYYYTVAWPKDVGNIQPNVDDNLFI